METSDLENRTKGKCSSAMDRTVKKQKQEPFILCLCAVCAAQFYHNPSMIKSAEPFNMALEIRDGMIPENNGKFRISIDKNGGRAIPMEQGEPEKSMDIARFGKMMFNKMRIYVNEIV